MKYQKKNPLNLEEFKDKIKKIILLDQLFMLMIMF